MQIIVALLINAIALLFTAYLVPGFHVADFTSALLAAIVLSVVNTFIKPILSFITAPITVLTLGLFALVVNAIILFIVSAVVSGFKIDGWLQAILGAIVLSIISTVLNSLLKDLGKIKLK